MRVKAIKRGYYGGRMVEPGESFEIPGKEALGRWMKPLDAVPKPDGEKANGGKPKPDGEKAGQTAT